MPWTDLLSADRIVMLVEPDSPAQVLDAAARLLSDGSPTSTATIADALRERERLGSTGIGHGVAIPHARSAAFHAPRAAFLRLQRPIDFGARDGEPVDLVLALSATDDMPELHLQHLAGVAERFSDAEFRDRLRMARSIDRLRRLLLAPATARAA
ncbi:MAG TPA: PTS sugar transporter subunit IIA [Luteimonas sp.]|nr:PTS sugar transporter subunit IIA [Luteimonas sp.]HRO26066.1 PTS sugar transporter subunit IIA [Luteimonas sp.]HRP71620.1 PTS sugar transporter subunit IIA [Luteimonas sp.]